MLNFFKNKRIALMLILLCTLCASMINVSRGGECSEELLAELLNQKSTGELTEKFYETLPEYWKNLHEGPNDFLAAKTNRSSSADGFHILFEGKSPVTALVFFDRKNLKMVEHLVETFLDDVENGYVLWEFPEYFRKQGRLKLAEEIESAYVRLEKLDEKREKVKIARTTAKLLEEEGKQQEALNLIRNVDGQRTILETNERLAASDPIGAIQKLNLDQGRLKDEAIRKELIEKILEQTKKLGPVQMAVMLHRLQRYQESAELFMNSKRYNRAAYEYFWAGDRIKAAEAFSKGNDHDRAAELFYSEARYSDAMKHYELASDRQSALFARAMADLKPNPAELKEVLERNQWLGRLNESVWHLRAFGDKKNANALESSLTEILKNDQVEYVSVLGGGITPSYLVTLKSGVKGVFKPDIYKKRLRFSDSEEAAYVFSSMLSKDFVPVTVQREIKGLKGSFQFYVQSSKPIFETFLPKNEDIQILDYLLQVADRHKSNIIALGPRQIAIDNATAFLSGSKIKINAVRGLKPSEDFIRSIHELNPREVRKKLKGLLSKSKIDGLLRRRRKLMKEYPLPNNEKSSGLRSK